MIIAKLKTKNNGPARNVLSIATAGGYTIIETMVAVSLFVIVVVFGLSSVLNAKIVDHKSKDTRSIMDNLSFIMEDISRNLRDGSLYRCYSPTDAPSFSPSDPLDTPRSCANGPLIVFEPKQSIGLNHKYVYKIDASGNLSRSTDSGNTWVVLNTDEVEFTSADYLFSVLGAEGETYPDTQQPLTTIRLSGVIHYKDIDTNFSLQSSFSQRYKDTEF